MEPKLFRIWLRVSYLGLPLDMVVRGCAHDAEKQDKSRYPELHDEVFERESTFKLNPCTNMPDPNYSTINSAVK